MCRLLERVSVKRLFVLCCSIFSSTLFAYTKTLTEQDLQQHLDAMMPIESTQLFATLKLSEPKIELIEGSDQLAIRANVAVIIANRLQGRGWMRVQGGVDYEAESGRFFFVSPEITDLELERLAEKYQPIVKQLAQTAMTNVTKRYAVYQLKDDDLQQRMAKSVLKSVFIENQRLHLEIGF